MTPNDPNAPVYATAVAVDEPHAGAVMAEVIPDLYSAAGAKIAAADQHGGRGAAEEPAPIFGPPSCSEEDAIAGLINRGMPRGLAEVVWGSAKNCAIRYWIVDNSGSMQAFDGKMWLPKQASRAFGVGSSQTFAKVQCSRWDELKQSLLWHGEVAAQLGCRTEFHLLNPPQGGAPQRVVVGAPGEVPGTNTATNYEPASLQALRQACESRPLMKTPLCEAVRKILADLQVVGPALKAAGKTACIIVASDGESSDGDVARALAPLQGLPCSSQVVVRLCTDDEKVVEYWNRVDDDLELELDVLDDVAGEGAEVHEHNPWLAYGEALQRTREWGVAPKVFDLLDERPLKGAEAAELVAMVLGRGACSRLPHPAQDPSGYLKGLDRALKATQPCFDPSVGKVVPWVDRKVFATAALGQSNCTVS